MDRDYTEKNKDSDNLSADDSFMYQYSEELEAYEIVSSFSINALACIAQKKDIDDSFYKKELILPSSFKGIPVKGFTKSPFRESLFEEKEGVPNSLNRVQKLTIPKEFINLGLSSFSKSEYLEEVIFEEGSLMEDLGRFAFSQNTKIKKIDLRNCMCLKEIPDGCFSGCSSLEEVMLPPSVKTLGQLSFEHCSSLKTINLKNILVFKTLCLRGTLIKEIDLRKEKTVLIHSGILEDSKVECIFIGENVSLVKNESFARLPFLKTVILYVKSLPLYGEDTFKLCNEDALFLFPYIKLISKKHTPLRFNHTKNTDNELFGVDYVYSKLNLHNTLSEDIL